jgi:hypothetical protein
LQQIRSENTYHKPVGVQQMVGHLQEQHGTTESALSNNRQVLERISKYSNVLTG